MVAFLSGCLLGTDSKNRAEMMKYFSSNAQIRYGVGAPLHLISETGAEIKTSPVEKVIASADGVIKLWTQSGTYYCICIQ